MPMVKPNWLFFSLILLIHLWFLANLRFTAWPEMLAYPYLINHGYQFYGDIIHPFMPLLPYALAGLIRFFGESVVVLKVITWTIILVSDILVFFIGVKLFGVQRALFTLIIFILWQIFFEGNGLWFDLAITPILLASYYFVFIWLKDKKSKDAFFLGLLLSLSFLIKQSSIWIILFLLIYFIIRNKEVFIAQLQSFLTGACIPISLTVFFLVQSSQWSDFLYWAIYYPFTIIVTMPGYRELPTLKQAILLGGIFFPAIAMIWQRKKEETIIVSLIFLFGGLLFSLHRFAYFHFQPALPYLAILITLSLERIRKNTALKFFSVLYIFISLFWQIKFLMQNWGAQTRFIEPHVISQTEALRRELTPATQVFAYNLPAQYFVLAQLLPTKPWVDTFPWYLELPGMQKMIVENLETSNTRYVLFSPLQGGESYTLGSYRPALIDKYIREKFQLKTKIDEILWILQKK